MPLDPRLENPVWHALSGSQHQFSQRHGRVLRFPAEIAPFVAVESAAAVDRTELHALVAPGETIDFVGIAPALDDSWDSAPVETIAQMHRDGPIEVASGPALVELDQSAAAQMLALTRLVYPGYFRARTHELGQYLGIFEEGQLVAMAGERMRIGPWQEISAVCTHPAHLGRGHAQRLVASLVNSICQRGQRPFLHVSTRNTRAIGVYQRLGFVTRTEIGVWLTHRRTD